MVAGIFAAHGFFFGKCREADDKNPKGYFENLWAHSHKKHPEGYFDRMRLEGWREQNLGVKGGESFKPWIAALEPDLVISTWREPKEIEASRKRAKLGSGNIAVNTTRPHVTINTTKLMRGDFSQIADAFAMLGLPFDEGRATEWIDPEIWNRGMTGNAKHRNGT